MLSFLRSPSIVLFTPMTWISCALRRGSTRQEARVGIRVVAPDDHERVELLKSRRADVERLLELLGSSILSARSGSCRSRRFICVNSSSEAGGNLDRLIEKNVRRSTNPGDPMQVCQSRRLSGHWSEQSTRKMPRSIVVRTRFQTRRTRVRVLGKAHGLNLSRGATDDGGASQGARPACRTCA